MIKPSKANLTGKILSKNGVLWEDNIKMDLREFVWGRGAWTGSIWLRIGTGGELS
jgi:hypothetical protein